MQAVNFRCKLRPNRCR